MYNHYHGNSGRVERVGDASARPGPPPRPQRPGVHPPAGPQPGLPRAVGELGRLLRRFSPGRLETEDLLLIALLYLLYRECGDRDFLIAIAAYFFL